MAADLEKKRIQRQISPRLIQAICRDLRAGNYKSVAAGANGVNASTFSHWEKRGREDIAKGQPATIYAALYQAVKRAADLGEKELLGIIRKAAQGWQGAAWILERTRPDRYAKRERIDLTVARREIAALSDRDLTVLAKQAASAQGTTLEMIAGPDGFEVPSEGKGGGES